MRRHILKTLAIAALAAPHSWADDAADRIALEALYHATDGPNWTVNDNWMSDRPLSDWHGVETDASGRVTELRLGKNGLRGPLPAEIGQLTSMRWLDLKFNRLEGRIPKELAELRDLENLELRAGFLSGEIPAELGGLAKLERLDLGRNSLDGSIPPSLAGLPALRKLLLAGNRLVGSVPTELSGLKSLEELDLGFNLDLSGTVPSGLSETSLRVLNVMATEACPPGDAPGLEWLDRIEFLPSGCGQPAAAVSEIDIAILYTPYARRRVGGREAMEALLGLWIAETNQAYVDSDVQQRLVPTLMQEVPYDELDREDRDMLDHLADPSDGYLDEVHAMRDQAGADLVHLVLDRGPRGCGLSELPGAYSISCLEADLNSQYFAHEIGHGMGLFHDHYVTNPGLLPFSHGYVNDAMFADGAPRWAGWRTIMAYSFRCGDAGLDCPRIMRFSNPRRTYLGYPLGTSGEDRKAHPTDASRALNISRHSVAAFRSRAPGTRPASVTTMESGMFLTVANLFSGSGSMPRRAAAVPEAETVRRREARVDVRKLLGASAVTLNLFRDISLTAIFESRSVTGFGTTLSGRLAGVRDGRATLSVRGNVVVGTVRLPGVVYRISPTRSKLHVIERTAPSAEFACSVE